MRRRPEGATWSPPGVRIFRWTARSAHLLLTAHQLTHDWRPAEDLLQSVLTKAGWPGRASMATRDPEAVRPGRSGSTRTRSWWRRRSAHERRRRGARPAAPSVANQHARPTGSGARSAGCPVQQRAVLLARYYLLQCRRPRSADSLGCSTAREYARQPRASPPRSPGGRDPAPGMSGTLERATNSSP